MVKLESICPEAIWHYDGKIGYVVKPLFPFVWELGVFKEDYFAFSKNRKRYKQKFWEKTRCIEVLEVYKSLSRKEMFK